MAWRDILGHDDVAERFRQSLARGRLSHAYLLLGPDGVGKERFARELAKAVLCTEGDGEACDACRSCGKVAHGNHPDVTTVRRADASAKGGRRAFILVDQVREAIQEPIALKPFEGRYKVFVVADADRMTEEAQNCLLKTLEEPPPSSLLLLVASRIEPFVDTVVSRCQVVRFRPLEAAVVERILVDGHQVEADTARVLASLSGGSPGRALRFLSSGAYETAVWLFGELATLQPGGEFPLAGELLDQAKDAGSKLEDAREQLRTVLDLVTAAWRDRLLGALGTSPELLAWGDACPEVCAVAGRLSAATARRLVDVTLQARERLDRNANVKLLLEQMLLDVCAALRGREPIHVR